jgi:predicted short-subunit dehydrogenase-like oxidoreductase (DUF2520 family)
LVSTAGRGGLPDLATDGQDLLLIAVPDGALAEVAARLAERPQAAVALHTSGSRDAAVLAPLRASGTIVGALHPLKAFPRVLPAPEQARGVLFALDGEPAAQQLARRLVAAWGGVAAEVPAAARALYHCAASLAAGGVATLLATAAQLAAKAGLPPAVERGYLELARGTVAAAIAATNPAAEAPANARIPAAAAVLTGPVARGDQATFERHMEALQAAAPEKLPLVLELARETLRQVAAIHPSLRHQELLAWIEEQTAIVGSKDDQQ